MRLLEFSKQFGGEEACKQYFKEFREKQGLKCSKCACTDFHWIPSHDRWQCKEREFDVKLGLRPLVNSGFQAEAVKQ